MGFYKNLEIELQQLEHDPELHEIVSWDIAHRQLMTHEERWAVLTDPVKLERALVLWRNATHPLAPRRAADHVALQVRRRDLRPKRSGMCVLGWSLIVLSVLISASILVVSL